jgi:ubiquitin C-terminal hydrolase
MDTQKIQTDSKEDIHFLINQLQNATETAASQHFSNNPLDDETQNQVRELMNQVRDAR